MSKYVTRKNGTAGKNATLARKNARTEKYRGTAPDSATREESVSRVARELGTVAR